MANLRHNAVSVVANCGISALLYLIAAQVRVFVLCALCVQCVECVVYVWCAWCVANCGISALLYLIAAQVCVLCFVCALSVHCCAVCALRKQHRLYLPGPKIFAHMHSTLPAIFQLAGPGAGRRHHAQPGPGLHGGNRLDSHKPAHEQVSKQTATASKQLLQEAERMTSPAQPSVRPASCCVSCCHNTARTVYSTFTHISIYAYTLPSFMVRFVDMSQVWLSQLR